MANSYNHSSWATYNPDYNGERRVAPHPKKHRTTRMLPPSTDTTAPEPRVIPSITMPQVSKVEISDADIGLDHTSTSQTAAEEFVRNALAYRARQALRANLSEQKAAQMVEQARKSRDAKAERLKLIGEVPARFNARAIATS